MDRNPSSGSWHLGVLAALLGSALFLWGPAWGAVTEPPKFQQQNYGKLPLAFIPNQGQLDERVKYYAQGRGSAFFFTPEGVVLSLDGGKALPTGAGDLSRRQAPPRPERAPGVVARLTPVEIRPGVQPVGEAIQAGKVNYFIGNDPGKWRRGLPTYGAVVYREAYPGIDLKFYGNGRQLEYDIVIRPGAEPSTVKFRYQGVKGLSLTGAGDLAIELPWGGSLVQRKPVVYQEIAGRRVAREGRFKLLGAPGGCTYGFEVGAFDPRYPLIIDPTLEYATYLGGSFWDEAWGIGVDQFGCAYVTGYTYSIYPLDRDGNELIMFPEFTAGSIPSATSVIFVTKLNPQGDGLEYSTFVGGEYDSYGYAVAVDGGCAYVTGCTQAAEHFPRLHAYQDDYGGGYWDAFIFKLDVAGNLEYSTLLGGSGLDSGRGIAVKGNDVLVTGKTFSTDFPTKNAFQPKSGGGGDGFAARLSYDADNLTLSLGYSTYLGGSGDDAGNGIAVDGAGNAYVAGETDSKNFSATLKAGRTGGKDAFVARFWPEGGRSYCVRLGGSKYDYGEAVAVDGFGNAYVTGYTYSSDFPTTGVLAAAGAAAAAQEAGGGSKKAAAASKGGGSQTTGTDAFVTKINADGNGYVYSVRLGGSSYDYAYGIAVDAFGCAYVTGGTTSADFPEDPPGGTRAGKDVFVTKLTVAGDGAAYSRCLQGNDDDEGLAIAVDGNGAAYVTGYTYSTDFHTGGSYQTTNNGDEDAFVAKIGP